MTLKKEISEIKISEIIKKARLVGFEKLPESTTQLEADIAAIFRETGKKYTAQAIHKLLAEKYSNPAKYYSDKLWYMEKKGTLEHCGVRGWYKFRGA